MKIVGLSGSLRRQSFNTGLLDAAAREMPEGSELTIETIRGIPLYDADIEEGVGIPARVVELKEALVRADGIILATPEYNHSMPGVFKNAIDWLSRPPADIKKVFGGKAVALMGATPGGFGTVLAQEAWLPVLRTLGTQPWFGGRLIVSRAAGLFDARGTLTDDATRQQIRTFIQGFVAWAGGFRRNAEERGRV